MTAIPVFSWQLYEETFGSRRAEIDSLINDIKDCWGDPLDWLPIDITPQPAANQLQTQGFRPQNWSLQYLRKLHRLAKKTKGRLDTAHSYMFSIVLARYESNGPFSDLTRYPHFMAEDMGLVEQQLQDALRDAAQHSSKGMDEEPKVFINKKDLRDSDKSAPKQVEKEQKQQQRQQQGKDATVPDDNAEKGVMKPKRSESEERQRIITGIRKDWPGPPEDWIPPDLRPLQRGKNEFGKEDNPLGWSLTLLKSLRSLSNHTKQNLDLAQLYMVKQVQKKAGKMRPLNAVDVGKVSEMPPILDQLAVEIKQRNLKRARKEKRISAAPITVKSQSRTTTQADLQPPTGDVSAPIQQGDKQQTSHEVENTNKPFVPEDAQHQLTATNIKLADQAHEQEHQRSPRIFKELIRLPSDDDTSTNFEFMIADPLDGEKGEREAGTEQLRVEAECSTFDKEHHITSAAGTRHRDESEMTIRAGVNFQSRESPPKATKIAIKRLEDHDLPGPAHKRSKHRQETTPRPVNHRTTNDTSSLPDCYCIALVASNDDHYCVDAGKRQDERANYEQAIVERDLHIKELEAKAARLEGQLRGKEMLIADLNRKKSWG